MKISDRLNFTFCGASKDKSLSIIFLLLACSLLFQSVKAQDIVRNGGLGGLFGYDGFSIPGWTFSGLIYVPNRGVDGGPYIGLSGGGFSQQLQTEPGQFYNLQFSYKGAAEGILQPGPIRLGVFWGSENLGVFPIENGSPTWITERLTVRATELQTLLTFTGIYSSPWIDGISVKAIPEPKPSALLVAGIAMLLGLGISKRKLA